VFHSVSQGQRGLAAIMFTDMVGFTALGQRNESLSLDLLEEQRRLIRPVLSKHNGREVKTIGDAFLVEFASAFEAVNCAVEIQSVLKESNRSAPQERRITVRIGIHLGDVVHTGMDVVGDAVNIASRIEPLSPPGGVCVSDQVFQSVVNKVEYEFESLGVPELKNVTMPVEVFRIVGVGGSVGRPAQRGMLSKGRVAVLPLDNYSPDPADGYFADGMTEELIDRLSQVRDLRVIARTSVMGYRGTEKKASEIGRELGVGTLVEGSVRKAGSRIRITVQLIDTATEEHIWSDRYDEDLDDIFAVQTEIASKITTALASQIEASISDPDSPRGSSSYSSVRSSQDTQDMEAYTSFLHGRKLLSEKGSEETIRQALAFFEAAVRRDPKFARARVGIAECTLWLGGEGAFPYQESVRLSRKELAEALELNDSLAEAHSCLAGLMISDDDFRGAERESQRAMELNPSLSDAYRWRAQIVAGAGEIDQAVRLLEAAQQVDPVDVNILAFLGRAYLYAGREADALAHWERTKPLIPFRTNAYLTEYYLGLQDYARAKETISEMERLRPSSVWTEMYRGFLAAREGDKGAARLAIDHLEKRAQSGELTVFFAGFVHFALDEMDAFVSCMEEAFRLHALPLMELMYSRLYAPARSDPRIVDLLRRQRELREPSY
jgi:adenylate cyclase